ncbi:glycosyltransferase family 4 protein [Teichococcus vastitatis]|uniref:Glycosyltransferase family 4 protein n=1 Tax=Teichococcus vastitatis TaxID=2307076 RepID=A0ABS9WB16_9PROT|nr:glycosyltransferase family 1 protein [Pseudoroseomonas vastitatis]MCI0756492.1 glycosyltransferase family 4 protein [Pseudoroseomonas vastitatis]
MRPRIYLDGYNLALDQGTGVATYARNLSFRLGAMGAEVGVLYGTRASPSRNPLIREIAFFDNRVGEPGTILRWMRNVRRTTLGNLGEYATQVPITGRVVATTFDNRMPHFDHLWNVENGFTQAANHFKWFKSRLTVRMPQPPQIMHWTYPIAMQMPGVKNIYCLHDLVPLRLPFTTLDHKRRYFRLNKLIAQKADHIVTVSEASRRDIINLLGADPDKVTNTYQSVELPRKFTDKPLAEARDEIAGSFGLGWKGYFLFFGAIEPKKNVGRMIEAFLASGSELPLVIVGKQAWKSEEELKLLFDDHIRYQVQEGSILRTRRKIILLDYAPFRLLVSLIRGAKAALFPSLYEGFGLPALEAMKLGTPVMTSNTSSLPEVVGDAALTVDPYDVRAMVEAIRALDTGADLRGQLAEAGPKRAALFSSEAYEKKLAEVYGRLGVRLDRPAATPPEAAPLAAE